jgi:pyruvate,water dikinase
MAAAFIRWFSEIGLKDLALVGGKNASLGELYRELEHAGVRGPNGFAVIAEGYRHFMRASGLDAKIAAILAELRTGDLVDLAERGLAIRQAITAAEFPDDLQRAMTEAYVRLSDGGSAAA